MAEQPAVAFRPPRIQDNPTGWGPVSVPEEFKDIPYQPFSKSDRLGKVADWTGGTYTDRRYANRYSSQYGAGGAAFSYFHEEDESTFHLVDSSRQPTRPKFGAQRRFQQQNQRRPQNPRRSERRGMQKLGGGQGGRQNFRRRDDRQTRVREASIEVRADWKLLEEIELARLAKLNFDVSEPEDVLTCGALEYYDKAFDRINTKNERPLQKVERVYHTVTTSDDPIIRNLSSEGGRVFATDAILATIMACPRSVYSWDIVVTRVGDKVFFDKREGSAFDLLTVNETAQDPPLDEADPINTPSNLAVEATYINRNFSQQVLRRGENPKKLENPNPFVSEGEEAASVAYRYRRWDIGGDITLVARCELDAMFWKKENVDEGYMTIKALNEYDPKTSSNSVDWRQKLDTQKGAVLATELKNNSFKLARWTASALLGGADQLKLGYVSRANRKNNQQHVILGTQGFNPGELATQINFNMNNAWGILRMFVDTCLRLPEGKYLILKDPNKAVVRIYEVPEDAFDHFDSDRDDDQVEPVGQ